MPKKIDPLVRERAVRLVLAHRAEYPSNAQAVAAVARQEGVGAESLRRWVIQAEIDAGDHGGQTSEEHAPTPRGAQSTSLSSSSEPATQEPPPRMATMSAAGSTNGMVTLRVRRDVADAIDARVAFGEYQDQDDVVRNGLRLLTEDDDLTRDPELERWLRDVAVPIAEATLADPSRSIPADDVHAHFAAKRAARARRDRYSAPHRRLAHTETAPDFHQSQVALIQPSNHKNVLLLQAEQVTQ